MVIQYDLMGFLPEDHTLTLNEAQEITSDPKPANWINSTANISWCCRKYYQGRMQGCHS